MLKYLQSYYPGILHGNACFIGDTTDYSPYFTTQHIGRVKHSGWYWHTLTALELKQEIKVQISEATDIVGLVLDVSGIEDFLI